MTTPRLPPQNDASTPDWWERSARFRRAPIIAIVILAAIILRATQGTPPPALTTDCKKPAFALATYSATQHQIVRWAMTGPPGSSYTLAVYPSASSGDSGQTAATPVRIDSDCKTDGSFSVLVPPGSYDVRMLLVGSGTSRPPVASHQFAVKPA